MTPPYRWIEATTDGHIGQIEFDDAEHLNPTDPVRNQAELHEALLDMHRDRDVRVVILTGRGRAFCAGANMRPSDAGPRNIEDEHLTSSGRLVYGYSFGIMWETLHHFRKPLIAAVNGYCLGGGWEIAHACDMVIAGESAIFGAIEIDIGLFPAATGCAYLTKMVGKHLANELAMTGRKLTARECLEMRLVNKVVADDQLMIEATALAAEIASRPPASTAIVKNLVKRAMDVTKDYDLERAYNNFVHTTDDFALARDAAASREPRPEFHLR